MRLLFCWYKLSFVEIFYFCVTRYLLNIITKKERILANAQIFDFQLEDADVRLLDSMHKGHRFGPDPDNFDF